MTISWFRNRPEANPSSGCRGRLARSGKISEVAVREAIHGRPIGNDTALANPECLAAYMALPELAEAV